MTTLAVSSAEARSPRLIGGWVRNPLWDATFMLPALWLAPLVWVLGAGQPDLWEQGRPVDNVYFVLTVLFWIGHRVSSTYLAYCTTAYRPLLRSERTRFVWLPIGIALFCFAVLTPPDDALPWTRAQRVLYLVIADYALVTYHFAAQHYGVLSLYRLRAGQARTPRSRLADRLFALGVGGVLVVVAEVIAFQVAFQHVWLDPLVDPTWLERARPTIQVAGTALVGAATLGMLALEALQARPSLGRVLYLLGLAFMVVTAFYAHFFVFLILWTVQHWMVAMGLATLVARGDPEPGTSRWYRLWHVLNRRAWLVLLLLVAVSAALLPFMEVEAIDPEGGTFYGDRLYGAFAASLRASWWAPALVALGLTTAFVHYAMDRAVFRFSNPEVRKAARGLLEIPRR